MFKDLSEPEKLFPFPKHMVEARTCLTVDEANTKAKLIKP